MIEQSSSTLPTEWGDFVIHAYAKDENDPMPHLAIVSGTVDNQQPVLVRIHSECFTGDVLGSLRCDCGPQLHASLALIGEKGGVIVYLRQEGRGIGLINKLKAYKLQEAGLDTVEANVHLGLAIDDRFYDAALDILKLLGVRQIRLLTNNPLKLKAIEEDPSLVLVERIPIIIPPQASNEQYLSTKKAFFGHWL